MSATPWGTPSGVWVHRIIGHPHRHSTPIQARVVTERTTSVAALVHPGAPTRWRAYADERCAAALNQLSARSQDEALPSADMHILVVEDDARLRNLLKRLLEEERHVVDVAADGEEGLDLAEGQHGFDIVILDVGLPDMSGLEVARRLRRQRIEVSILMLTARDTVGDRVTGLDAGADDYLVKPFAFAELSARLRALSRRSAPGPRRSEPKLVVGPITLDEARHLVTVNGQEVDLSPREYSLLECFLRHPGQALTRDQLLDHAWPFGVAVTPNAVDAYVHYLREKLGDAGELVRTVRGVGYRLGSD
jgi:DNA-binding response OmpR family regulator